MRIKFEGKRNLAKPLEADEVRLVSAHINFRDGPFEARIALVDSDGADGGAPAVIEEMAVQMGLADAAEISLDRIERDVLNLIAKSGVLPGGGAVNEE